jgi:hypothetical protein
VKNPFAGKSSLGSRAERSDSLELVSGMRVRNQGGRQVRVVLATLRQVHARRLCVYVIRQVLTRLLLMRGRWGKSCSSCFCLPAAATPLPLELLSAENITHLNRPMYTFYNSSTNIILIFICSLLFLGERFYYCIIYSGGRVMEIGRRKSIKLGMVILFMGHNFLLFSK